MTRNLRDSTRTGEFRRKSWKSLAIRTLPAVFGLLISGGPVLAQHAGSSGHAGGGGHASGASSSSGSHVGAAHSATGGVRGPSLAPMMAGRSASGSSTATGGKGFNVGSSVWANPRGARVAGPRVFATARPLSRSTPVIAERMFASESAAGPLAESFVPGAMRIRFRRPGVFFFSGGCFDGFFPQFCGFGPGFFGFPFWEFSVFEDDGFPPLENFGYPYEPSMSDDIETRVEHQPQYYESAPYGYSFEHPASGGATIPTVEPDREILLLYLKDGSVYALTNYWVADAKLHYVTSYGGENAIPLDQVDLQHTVDVNGKRGIPFVLAPRDQAPPGPLQNPPSPN